MQSVKQVVERLATCPATKVAFELAQSESAEIYLVGESLRDLFLDAEPAKYRFVMKPDPAEFARKLAARAPGTIRTLGSETRSVSVYESETGTLEFSRLNVAGIKEYLSVYSEFTLHSLALDLRSKDLLDFVGATADIRAGTVRLLAPVAPGPRAGALLLRAVGQTLLRADFSLAPSTALDIKNSKALLAEAGNPRSLGSELTRIIRSGHYRKGVLLLNELGLLAVLFERFLPGALSRGQDDDAGTARYADWFAKLSREVDELTPGPCDFITKNTHLLRYAALLTPHLRQGLLASAPERRKSFIVAAGEQLEVELSALLNQVSSAFRVRMITTGYLSGLSRLAHTSSGLHDLRGAVEYVIKTFGSWKGMLSSILLCADWLASAEAGQSREAREAVKGMLEAEAGVLSVAVAAPLPGAESRLLQSLGL